MFCIASIMALKIAASWNNHKTLILYLSLPIFVLAMKQIPIHFITTTKSAPFFIDHISFPIIMMTILLMIALETCNLFSTHSNFLMILSLLTFMVSKMFLFYVLFELNLIPIFLVILGWGYQPERLFASKMMMFYTLVGSLPLLLMVIYHPNLISMSSTFLSNNMSLSSLMLAFLTVGFLVKLPIFSLHLWLPLAHVEAPIMGSMILAGILLKLGGYGLMRMNTLFSNMMSPYPAMMLILCSIGSAIALLFCVTQVDLKIIIAYSSVGHMSLAAASMFSLSSLGNSSALINLVTHGFTSSLMFFLASVMYQISKTRHILLNKGMLCIAPTLIMAWFITCLLNAGGPPSLNLLAEILATITMLNFSMGLTLFVSGYLLLGMLFNMKVFSITSQGNPQERTINSTSLSFSESLTCVFHLLASFIMLASLFCMMI